MSAKDNPAWCSTRHDRAGLVTNQNPDEPYDPDEPYASVSVCARGECIAKAIRKVAGSTNRQAAYYDDFERRAKRAST